MCPGHYSNCFTLLSFVRRLDPKSPLSLFFPFPFCSFLPFIFPSSSSFFFTPSPVSTFTRFKFVRHLLQHSAASTMTAAAASANVHWDFPEESQAPGGTFASETRSGQFLVAAAATSTGTKEYNQVRNCSLELALGMKEGAADEGQD